MYYFGAASIVTVTTAGLLYAYGTCCRRNRQQQQQEQTILAEYTVTDKGHLDLHMIGDGIETQLSNHVAPLYNVLQEALGYLTQNKLRMDGIFRESGNLTRSKNIYADMTLRRSVINESEHDVVSALKIALNEVLTKGLFNGKKLYTNMMTSRESAPSPAKTAFIFKQHIQQLIDNNMKSNAAIIHDLLYLGYIIQREQAFNRMTTDNVAKILAPHFMKICDMPEPAHGREFEYLQMQENTKLILKELITHPYFSRPFNDCLIAPAATRNRRVL